MATHPRGCPFSACISAEESRPWAGVKAGQALGPSSVRPQVPTAWVMLGAWGEGGEASEKGASGGWFPMVRARRNRGVDVDTGGGWESAGTDPGTQRAHRPGRRDWPEGGKQAGRTDRRVRRQSGKAGGRRGGGESCQVPRPGAHGGRAASTRLLGPAPPRAPALGSSPASSSTPVLGKDLDKDRALAANYYLSWGLVLHHLPRLELKTMPCGNSGPGCGASGELGPTAPALVCSPAWPCPPTLPSCLWSHSHGPPVPSRCTCASSCSPQSQ